MQPVNIEISGNQIRGTKFGGLFLMGSGNRIIGNALENLDTAGCNENAARFGCLYKTSEPELLESGIYLAPGGSRPVETRGNVIRNNRISGHRMRAHCIAAAPGVSLSANIIESNACADTP
jgi:parallel beta-helix repeat protein